MYPSSTGFKLVLTFSFPIDKLTVTSSLMIFFLFKDNVSKANRRIILASLYLGTGEKEQQLVGDFITQIN